MRTVLAVALLAIAFAGCGGSDRSPGPVRPADSFVDSIGVNVHITYTDTPYGDRRRTKAALRELGVRHIRDGLEPNREDQYRALRDLAADGIRANLILGDPRGRFGTGSLEEQVSTLRSELRDSVASVEGPNEFDATGGDWLPELRDYQQRLHDRLSADPELRDIPLLAPTFLDPAHFSDLGAISGLVDYGNIHPYPGGEPPESNIQEQLQLASQVAGKKPVFATETGYHNAVRARSGQPAVSEQAAAAYAPRAYLDYYRAGVRRTFWYELFDERAEPARKSAEQHFGLVRHDGRRKPAFRAIRNLIALLMDPGPAFEARGLDYDVTGDVSHLLLQKRDGTWFLALWQTGSADSDAVTADVDLREAVDRARLYRPSRSPRPVWSRGSSKSLRVNVPADPVLLRLERG